MRSGENTQLYHLVRVNNDELEVHGYTADGQWFDGFGLTQLDGSGNRVTELDEQASVEQ